MADPVSFPGDVSCNTLYAKQILPLTPSSGGITDALIAAAAAIQATKLQHQYCECDGLFNKATTPSALNRILRVIRGATGSVVRFEGTVINPVTAGSITIDLYKNGVSILTAPFSLTTAAGSGGTAYDKVAASIATAAVVQGDVLEVVVTVSGLTGGGGLAVQLTTREDPQ